MKHSLIIYDGHCAFCTWCILFVIQHGDASQYRFTETTSDTSKKFVQDHTITITETIWLIDENQYFYKSSAALRIIGRIGGIYRLAYLGRVAPRLIRDWIYDFIAKRRRLFKNNVCPVIPQEYEHLFIH